eukprot:gb/GFBE01077390.1/.p1 GENE.gb/GFBE01077390.1/~~gb/GFBE01077390.1/.p1  ORF type:complete len:217 (+),score=27.93 gb/GFBE01077390.1/:1-651(+)
MVACKKIGSMQPRDRQRGNVKPTLERLSSAGTKGAAQSTPAELQNKATGCSFAAVNPKKVNSNSWHRYARYKEAQTVGHAFRLGATAADLKFDWSHGHMTLQSGGGSDSKEPPVARPMGQSEHKVEPLPPTAAGTLSQQLFSLQADFDDLKTDTDQRINQLKNQVATLQEEKEYWRRRWSALDNVRDIASSFIRGGGQPDWRHFCESRSVALGSAA